MPRFIDTRGHTKVAIAICARCGLKHRYDELRQDPNFPGLYVCDDDYDQFDPYRLPARKTELINLDHPRPDIGINTYGPSPILAADPIIVVLPTSNDDLTTEGGDVITTEGGQPITEE